jgi:glycosyltransferase involved in cell wall biosynthesis
MRILFVTMHLPGPTCAHAGGVVDFNTLRFLARDHELSLLSFALPGQEGALAPLRPHCAEITLVPWGLPFAQKLRKLLRILARDPLHARRPCWYEMRAAVQDAVRRDDFDLVHVSYPELFYLAPSVRGPVTVAYEMEVGFFPPFNDYLLEPCIPQRWRHYLKYRLKRAQELRRLEAFDHVVALSESERALLHQHRPWLEISIVPPVTHVARFAEIPIRKAGRNLVFVGAMARPVNERSILYFCEEILPLIRQQVPDVQLYIVGKAPSERVRRLAGDGVTVTGWVDDIGAYYERATVVVAPMKYGGGLITKNLDAMAAGRPLVTTTLGQRGIGANGHCLAVADAPALFAARTVELLINDRLWFEVARAGRAFVLREYSEARVAARTTEVYRGMLH